MPGCKRVGLSGLLVLLLLLVVTAGQAAPVDYQLRDIEGRLHALSDYRGKWLVVNFWATWCPPCRAEMPDLELFHDAHKDSDAVVIGISMGGSSVEQVRAFGEEMFISFLLLMGDASGVTPLGTVTGLPTTFILSPEGEVVTRFVGPVSREKLERFLERNAKPATGGS